MTARRLTQQRREHILKRFGHPLPYEVVELYTVSQGEPGKLEGLHRAAKSALQPKRGDPFIEGRRPFEACETYLAAVTELLVCTPTIYARLRR